MSEPRRTHDPSGQAYVTNNLARTYDNIIDTVQYTLLDLEEFNQTLLEELLGWMSLMMQQQLVFPTELSIRRGIYASARDVNRLTPDFQAGAGWLPSDDALRDKMVESHTSYISKMTAETKARVLKTVEQGRLAGESYLQIGERLKETFKFTREKANQYARTELMNAYNTSARLRYKSWGIKRYRFWAHLDACNERKKLRDGTVVQGGCTELHGQDFPVEDDVHCPPIHTYGRCTILPMLPTERLKKQPLIVVT